MPNRPEKVPRCTLNLLKIAFHWKVSSVQVARWKRMIEETGNPTQSNAIRSHFFNTKNLKNRSKPLPEI
jgi:hypothetical protein